MMCMSLPEPCTLPAGLLPQEADRRCDFVGVDGVNAAGVESLVGGDVSTSRQDTDGDLMCCRGNENNVRTMRRRFADPRGRLRGVSGSENQGTVSHTRRLGDENQSFIEGCKT